MPCMKDSLLNYKRTSLVDRSDLTNLNDKQMMLVHGMADRRILLQNTMMLSKRMVEENMLFEQQVPLLFNALQKHSLFYYSCIQMSDTTCSQFSSFT